MMGHQIAEFLAPDLSQNCFLGGTAVFFS